MHILSRFLLITSSLWGARVVAGAQQPDACQSTGLDYTDNGSYLIDGSAPGNFSFASIFEGSCSQVLISPTIRDQDNNKVYSCSAISPDPSGSVQISTCSIPYSSLTSGNWQIVVPLSGTTSQDKRSFRLTVTKPPTTTTAEPPPTPSGPTRTETTTITTTLTTTLQTTLAPSIVTVPCNTPATLTSTTRLSATTVTETRTILQYTTSGTVTSPSVITRTLIPTCRFPSISTSSSSVRVITTSPTITPAPPTPSSTPLTGAWTFTVSGSTCVGNPPWGVGGGRPDWRWGGGRGGGWGGGRGGGWGGGRGGPPWGNDGGSSLPAWITCNSRMGLKLARRTDGDVTVTKTVGETVSQTVTPPARTACEFLPDRTEVVTVPGPKLTVLTVVTAVTQVVETVFVTQTVLTISNDMVSATACWNAGGVYGV